MMPVDLRRPASETASRRWFAFKTKKGEALAHMSQQDVWEECWRWCTAWFLSTSAAISPAVDAMARLVEYASDARETRCPHCGMEL